MTRVRIDKSGLGRDIYITGHCANENSGSAEATLVCAAMTTLAQTIRRLRGYSALTALHR